MDMKQRCKLMLHLIAIMKYLRERYNNFNSYLAILSAIESSPVSRLDWPDKVIKVHGRAGFALGCILCCIMEVL